MTGLRRTLFVALIGVGGVAVLLYLALWQVQRLGWKTALITELEEKLAAPATPVRGDETAASDAFRPALATGRYLAPPQARYLTSYGPHGAGFRLITPFEIEPGGLRILVDRGFVPATLSPRGAEPPAPPDGLVTVEGALSWPNEASYFTPDANQSDRVVFARDVAVMAEMLGAEPILLVARSGGTPAGERWPEALPVRADLPNDHLEYALTWFSMAAIWAVMTYFVARPRRRDAAAAAAAEG